MGNRVFNRVAPNLPVDCYWDGDLHEGIVRNLSGNGMYIEADTCPAGGANIKIALVLGDEIFRISGKVKRTKKRNGSNSGMGIELLDPSLDYRRFVCIVHDYIYNSRPRTKENKHINERIMS